MNKFTVNHSQLKEALLVNIKANTIPLVLGSPAIGKSAIIAEVAKDLNLELIDLRLTQLQPYDLAGLIKPYVDVNGKHKATYAPVDIFPLTTTALPQGKDGWLLFLDEFNSADKYTLAAAYKLLLDRMIGEHKLHDTVRIACAGNHLTDGAIAHKLPTAIQSRVTHLNLETNPDSWVKSYLNLQTDWSPYIVAFLNFKTNAVNTFDPKKDVVSFASPRTWEMLSKLIEAGLLDLDKSIKISIIMGTVGEQAGHDFVAFLDVFSSLPTIKQIEKDPDTANMPEEIGAKWALGIHLAKYINKSNEDAIITYLERMVEDDIKVITYRTMIKSYNNLKNNTNLQQIMLKIRNSIM